MAHVTSESNNNKEIFLKRKLLAQNSVKLSALYRIKK